MIRFCRVALALVLVTSVLQNTAAAPDDGWRTIEFETTEVTSADVAVSPDGQWLIFTILGHLFHLPVEGGDAEQLTFGPYYDSDPVFSPDGSRVARAPAPLPAELAERPIPPIEPRPLHVSTAPSLPE